MPRPPRGLRRKPLATRPDPDEVNRKARASVGCAVASGTPQQRQKYESNLSLAWKKGVSLLAMLSCLFAVLLPTAADCANMLTHVKDGFLKLQTTLDGISQSSVLGGASQKFAQDLIDNPCDMYALVGDPPGGRLSRMIGLLAVDGAAALMAAAGSVLSSIKGRVGVIDDMAKAMRARMPEVPLDFWQNDRSTPLFNSTFAWLPKCPKEVENGIQRFFESAPGGPKTSWTAVIAAAVDLRTVRPRDFPNIGKRIRQYAERFNEMASGAVFHGQHLETHYIEGAAEALDQTKSEARAKAKASSSSPSPWKVAGEEKQTEENVKEETTNATAKKKVAPPVAVIELCRFALMRECDGSCHLRYSRSRESPDTMVDADGATNERQYDHIGAELGQIASLLGRILRGVRMGFICAMYRLTMQYWVEQDRLRSDFGRLQSAAARAGQAEKKEAEIPDEKKQADRIQELEAQLTVAKQRRFVSRSSSSPTSRSRRRTPRRRRRRRAPGGRERAARLLGKAAAGRTTKVAAEAGSAGRERGRTPGRASPTSDGRGGRRERRHLAVLALAADSLSRGLAVGRDSDLPGVHLRTGNGTFRC